MRINEIIRNEPILVVFDMDDTLLNTTAKVYVIKPDGTREHLIPSEFNDYVLQVGEHFDWSEFGDSSKLKYDSTPIETVVERTQGYISDPAVHTVLITARGPFDDHYNFVSALHTHGIEILPNDCYTVSGSLNKKPKIIELIGTGNYKEIILYDDSFTVIKDFLTIHNEYPHIKFTVYPVINGEIKNKIIAKPR